MNLRIMLGLSVGFNAALVGALTYVCEQSPDWDQLPGGNASAAPTVSLIAAGAAPPRAFAARPGVVIDAVLPDSGPDVRPMLFDLETGRQAREPAFDHQNSQASIVWIQTNGMDIAGFVPANGRLFCITYYLAVLPVSPRYWDATTLAEIPQCAELNAIRDPKRRVLVPSDSDTDTYLFRTAEGATGLLQIQGATADVRGVKLRYKLLPATAAPITIPSPVPPITAVTGEGAADE